MEKLAFALDVEDGWPPVATEHVWCEKTGPLYQLKNAPFFIKGLAFGDTFSAEPDAVNGCIFEFTVVERSGHSLVWIMAPPGLELEHHKDALLGLGLYVEDFPQCALHAVDVPASVDGHAVNALMDRLEDLEFAMAYPVWQIGPRRKSAGGAVPASEARTETQEQVCSRLGVAAVPSRAGEKLGIALATIGKLPIHGLRIPLEGTCGWFIWCGEERSDDADFYQPLHVEHIGRYLPAVEPYLSLRPGSRFVIADGYEDVWFEPALLSGK